MRTKNIFLKRANLKRVLLLGILTALMGWGATTLYGAEVDKDEMVFMPAGEFVMGGDGPENHADEQPPHKVFLDAFYIDRFEVTGKDFEAWMNADPNVHPTITGWHGRKVRPGMEKRPVIGLTWTRCRNYCQFRGKRLLTEAEWERAAAGTERRLYPWGKELPDPSRANFGRCCFIMKGEVLNDVAHAQAGQTPDGIHDMSGNIAEWVHDWYDKNYYRESPTHNPTGPSTGKHHVIRGGAWNSLPGYLRSSARYGYDDAKDFYGIGCRCAKSAEISSPDSKSTAMKGE